MTQIYLNLYFTYIYQLYTNNTIKKKKKILLYIQITNDVIMNYITTCS